MIALTEQEKRQMNAAAERAMGSLWRPITTTTERLGAVLARRLPVKLGSPANAEEYRQEWSYELTGKLPSQSTTPTSWWSELLEATKQYLETEQAKAKAEAEATVKTAEVPAIEEKTWLEKNFGWVLLGGLALMVTLAVIK
jgi:hypothetical protein